MIEIGQSGNEKIGLDLEKLLIGRMLIQATSGGGKSWCLRRILEQSHGKVQQIVIDLDAEFLSLREKFDYVIAGKEGDTACDHRIAKLLARRLMELRASAIIDLSDLKKHEREWFVKAFLEALISLPLRLWNPCLVVIDEAHHFAPQTTKSESTGAVIDLITRGRKKGLSAILTTQRISKLHKDAAAELLNVLCGNTTLDNDQRRAADILGITNREDRIALRQIKIGHFYAFGPAVCGGTPNDFGVIDVAIGPVVTTHDRRLLKQQGYKAPEPTSKIQKLLGGFKDLPAEVQQEEEVVKRLQRELVEMRRNLGKAQKSQLVKIKEIVKPCEHLPIIVELKNEIKRSERVMKEMNRHHEKVKAAVDSSFPDIGSPMKSALRTYYVPEESQIVINTENSVVGSPSVNGLKKSHQKIVNAIAVLHNFGIERPSRQAVAGMSGYSSTGGGFNNYLGALRSGGYVEYPESNIVILTEEGFAISSPTDELKSIQDLHERWYNVLKKPHARILRVVLNAYPETISREELAAESGYQSTGGGFNNYLGSLRTRGLICYPNSGFVKATEALFPGRLQ